MAPSISPIIMVQWKMGAGKKMTGFSQRGPFSTSMIMGERVNFDRKAYEADGLFPQTQNK